MQKLTRLKEALFRKNISSLQMAYELGINPSQLSLYINGWKEMPDFLKGDIAEFLNVPESELFEESPR